jgi:hypothetical protein
MLTVHSQAIKATSAIRVPPGRKLQPKPASRCLGAAPGGSLDPYAGRDPPFDTDETVPEFNGLIAGRLRDVDIRVERGTVRGRDVPFAR